MGLDLMEPLGLEMLEPKQVDSGVLLTPYSSSDDFTEEWWEMDRVVLNSDTDTVYFSVLKSAFEVARLSVVDDGLPVNDAFGVPESTEDLLEVSFIETAHSVRRQGVATAALNLLRSWYPERGLMAFSEEADSFWDSLQWERYEHCEGTQFNRPLYVKWGAQIGGGPCR